MPGDITSLASWGSVSRLGDIDAPAAACNWFSAGMFLAKYVGFQLTSFPSRTSHLQGMKNHSKTQMEGVSLKGGWRLGV